MDFKNEYYWWIIGLFVFTLIYLFIPRRWFNKSNPVTVSKDLATDSLDRVSSWATWMAGLQVAAIGFMGYLLKEKACLISLITEPAKQVGFSCLLFFGASILLCSFLLQGLPSIQIRLNTSKSSPSNDVFEMQLFDHKSPRMGTIFGLMHTYFLIGIVFFCLFAISLLELK